MPKMVACTKTGPGKIELKDVEIPRAGHGEVVVRVTLTSVCGSDLHVLDNPYMGKPDVIMGHEIIGTIHEIGEGVEGYEIGQRVLASCITPCGSCLNCLAGEWSACIGEGGGFQYGLIIDGGQAEYVRIPFAEFNIEPVLDSLSDRQALFAGDIMSTGFGGVERSELGMGDTIAIFGQGPLGLCALAAARLRGAGLIIAVESIGDRQEKAHQMGADVIIDPTKANPVKEIKKLTGGVGADVSIEAVGVQPTFESALLATRLGGTVSSLGVYGGERSLSAPLAPNFYHRKIVTTLCPSGRLRLRKMMALVANGKVDLSGLWTHEMAFEKVLDAYDLFTKREDGVLKIALIP